MAQRDIDQQIIPDEESSASLIGRTLQYGATLAIVLLVLFLVQNLQQVEVNFLWFEWNVRMIWALLASAVFGALGSMLIYFVIGRMRRRQPRA